MFCVKFSSIELLIVNFLTVKKVFKVIKVRERYKNKEAVLKVFFGLLFL
jgi:hypothetical protein